MSLTENIYSNIPMYPKQISISELSKSLGVEYKKIKKAVMSMNCLMPIAEDEDGKLTKVKNIPYGRCV